MTEKRKIIGTLGCTIIDYGDMHCMRPAYDWESFRRFLWNEVNSTGKPIEQEKSKSPCSSIGRATVL